MRYPLQLKANVPFMQPFRGKGVLVVNPGPAGVVTVTLYVGSEQKPSPLGTVPRNFSLYAPDQLFTGGEFVSTVDGLVEIIVTDYEMRANDGSEVTATLDAGQLPLPVVPDRGGDAGTPVFVSGVTLAETPATVAVDNAAVAVGGVAVQIQAADATRLESVVYNQGPDPVAIGRPGLTWAKRSIVLNAGDGYVEARIAALALVAITDAGQAASVTVQERKS